MCMHDQRALNLGDITSLNCKKEGPSLTNSKEKWDRTM